MAGERSYSEPTSISGFECWAWCRLPYYNQQFLLLHDCYMRRVHSYKQLGTLRQDFANVPFTALTATATRQVRDDV